MICYVICSTKLGCGQCLIWWWANFSGASSLLHTQWLSPRRQKLGPFAARNCAPLLCCLWGLVYQAACPRLRACTSSMTRNLDILWSKEVVKGSWEAILPCYGFFKLMKGGARCNNTSCVNTSEKNWLWWRVVRDVTIHHVSIHQKRIDYDEGWCAM